MKRFLLIYFLMVASVFPQAGRPPITNLNGLSDVTLTSPADGDALIYNSASSQWINSVLPGGALSALSDVTIITPLDNQLLKYSSASSKWSNYGPLNFTDLAGNISVSQMGSGAGATSTTYWRGDNSWASPPTGAITSTTNLLVGDNAGNAIGADVTAGLTLGSTSLALSKSGNFSTDITASNPDSTGGDTTVQARLLLQTTANVALTSLGPNYVTSGIRSASDGVISNDAGDIDLTVPATFNLKFSNDGGTTERIRFGNGIMVGTFTDKGSGTVNVSGGYYVNGVAITGTGTVTSFSAGNLTPLFTTTVSTATTTPALAFTLSTAAPNTVFGNATGSTAMPTFSSSPRFTAIGNLTTNGFLKTQGGVGNLAIDTATYLTSNQTITLTGDVTGSGATSIATTYNNAVPTTKAGLPTGGTAGQTLTKNSGTNYDTAWGTMVKENASTSNQSVTTADTYIAGSSIVVGAGNWAAGGQYKCRFEIVKTAASTATWALNIRVGTGVVGDTAIIGGNFYPQTASIDTMIVDLNVNIRTIGASATSAGNVMLIHAAGNGVGYGLAFPATPVAIVQSATFNSTTATTIGVSFNGGASHSGTVTTVQASYMQ
jgi:hypothetical protein